MSERKLKVNTNAVGYGIDTGFGAFPNNFGSTERDRGSKGSGKGKVKITYNGVEYPLETRYDRNDGSTAGLIIIREDSDGDGTQESVPIVLYTADRDGGVVFGGTGDRNEDGVLESGQFFGAFSNPQVTSEVDARALIGTATRDGVGITTEQFLSESNTRVNGIWEDSGYLRQGEQTNQGVKPHPISATDPKVVAPGPDVSEESGNPIINTVDQTLQTVDDLTGEVNRQITGITTAAQGALGDIQEQFNGTIENLEKIWNLIGPIDPDLLRDFKFSEKDFGNHSYPSENTYGDRNGQDYMCITQYSYKPPRKDQIFAEGAPAKLLQGNKRLTPLKKKLGQVKLPMPNKLSDSNQVSWGSDEMNNLSAMMTATTMANPRFTGGAALIGSILGAGDIAALGAILSKSGINLDGLSGANKAQVSAALGSKILSKAGIEIAPETILARGFGVVPNSNMELLFNAPTLREFQFSWRMSPRSRKEAEEIRRIIRFFKQGMAAKKLTGQAGDASVFLGTPNIFKLQYKTVGGKIIEGVNRIKPCAIVGTNVDYSPEGNWSAYDEGQPSSIILSIQAKELEPIYDTDYQGDRISGRISGTENRDGSEGDLYSIIDSEVGY